MRIVHVLPLVLFASMSVSAQEAQRPSLTIGDSWSYERTDRTRKVVDLRQLVILVSRIETELRFDRKDLETGTVTQSAENADYNNVETDGRKLTGFRPDFSWPLTVGKKWEGKYSGLNQSRSGQIHSESECEVAGVEPIQVKAGSFQSFKIVCKGTFRTPNNNGQVTLNGRTSAAYWYAPEVKRTVKVEYRDDTQYGVFNNSSSELVSFELKK